jgi:bifunctional non-homologous end joining protein LigD
VSLQEYRKKRNFNKTREPATGKSSKKPIFVVQEHWASHLHYDFRLEAFGTLKSWAVPKGPSTEVGEKRLAVEVEDHPIDYAKFHGTIPKGEYGAGRVKIWDHGVWTPPDHLKDNLKQGHLEFELKGKKMHGRWLLQRTNRTTGKKNQWLLIKRHDPIKKSRRHKNDPWPKDLSPQLALLSTQVPAGPDWLHEIKFDGYRTLTTVKKKAVTFLTRSGLDWSKKYKALEKDFKNLKIDSAVFDGEIVALNEKGQSNFSDLQIALHENDFGNVVYYLFDLLYLNGEDLRRQPLELRKQKLKEILGSKANNKGKLRFSEHFRAQGKELFTQACHEGLEGIVSKNRNLAYHSGRNDDWQKIKCSQRQEFVIGGYTDPEGSRIGFGSLLMGVYDQGKFRYIGRVGTGFNSKLLGELTEKLKALQSPKSSFTLAAPQEKTKLHWVKPNLVAEIEFKTWTKDKILRQASFQGLREDKNATEVHIESPSPTTSQKKKSSALSVPQKSGFNITHPERLIYPRQKITKLDVANYYKSVAPWLLEHLQNRPLSLIRCPKGASQQCFFQKHVNDNSKMTAIHEDLVRDQKVIFIDSDQGLLQLIQWGVLELHTWQCHSENLEHPDQIVFDLDPDEAVPWKQVIASAYELKELLEKLDLTSFVKTTGGKGLHLHVPILPLYTWDQVKSFSKSVTLQMQSENPDLYTSKMAKKERGGKIFLDYLRNGFGATSVAPYSLRAKENPVTAVPITWTELQSLKGPQVFELDSTLKRLAHLKKDPWTGYFRLKQKIKILKSN